jgi:hypothetical protein
MNARLARSTVLALAIQAASGLSMCHADSTIADIVKNDDGKITVGVLTFTFTDSSVTSDQFDGEYTPTAANITVTTVTGGLEFSINPMAALRGAVATTDKITIAYTVSATSGITGAGLSFSGYASGVDASSMTTETFASRDDMLNVYTKAVDDMQANNQKQNNQSVALTDKPTSLSVTDVGQLSIPNRGGGGTSDTQISSITNTFTAPEPASWVNGSIAIGCGALLWIHASWRRKRASMSPAALETASLQFGDGPT